MMLKRDFCNSDCFRRLPRELRRLYRDMHLKPGPSMIEHQLILSELHSALSRKKFELQTKLPTFLNIEMPRIPPRRKRTKKRKVPPPPPEPPAMVDDGLVPTTDSRRTATN